MYVYINTYIHVYICIYLGKCLFKPFAHFFKLGFLERVLKALYIFCIEVLYQIQACIDFLPVCLPFQNYKVFKKQNFIIFMKSSVSIFLLWTVPLLLCLRNLGQTLSLKDGLFYILPEILQL